MDRLCQYSSIIFAGNVSVLLIVSIMTDYWQYRGFQSLNIQTALPKTNTTSLAIPGDTDSYLVIRYMWDRRPKTTHLHFSGNISYYESPALLHRYQHTKNVSKSVWAYNGVHNVSIVINRPQTHRLQDDIILFVQYGNLFRDCDSLEVGVRRRLGLTSIHAPRCINFIVGRRDDTDFVHRDLPAVIYLERGAFFFAVICIISSVVSLVAGSYGSMMHIKTSFVTASSAALISGMTLTVAIALFHVKCHLLERREFMAGVDVPYKRLINESRTNRYGWSFVLAWVCVVLCFIHAWIWLHKAQDMRSRHLRCRVKTNPPSAPDWTHDSLSKDFKCSDDFITLSSS